MSKGKPKMFTKFYCKAFYEALRPSALTCYDSFTCFCLCVSRTCGIVHCYRGGYGAYQIPNDRWQWIGFTSTLPETQIVMLSTPNSTI